MYILFEKSHSDDSSEDIYVYDAIGYTDTECVAYAWVAENEGYRIFKYCPNNKIL